MNCSLKAHCYIVCTVYDTLMRNVSGKTVICFGFTDTRKTMYDHVCRRPDTQTLAGFGDAAAISTGETVSN
jgi:hypothetical protein